MSEITTNKNKLLVQHNNLINGRFDMTAHELRIFVYLLAQIGKDDDEFKLYKLPVKYITNSDKPGGNDYKIIKQYADTLPTKMFKLEKIVAKTVKKGVQYLRQFDNYNVYSMVSWVEGENYLQVKFNNDLKGYLLDLSDNFTKADIENISKVNSVNAYRLYWLIKQHNRIGQRQIPLDEFKEMLMLDDKYPEFRHLKTRIILPAQKELEATDMAFDFEPVKRGKSIVGIRFTIRKYAGMQKQTTIEDELNNPLPFVALPAAAPQASGKEETDKRDLAYYNLTTVWGLTDTQAKDLMAKTTPADILVKIAKLQVEGNTMKKNKATMIAVGAFIYNGILEALKKDYFNSKAVVAKK